MLPPLLALVGFPVFQIEPYGCVQVLNQQTSPRFIPDILGSSLYPLPRLGFSFGIRSHLAIAFLNIAIYDMR